MVGEFSRGKSTLINAMLGRRLLPARLRPTTSTLIRVRHGAHDAVEVLKDGVVTPWTMEKLPEVTSVGGQASGVREVHIAVDVPLLADGVEIVDTPGVNDLSTLREDITLAHLPDADAAIFVLDAKACFTDSERRFLTTSVLASNVARIFFVVNKLDQLDPPYNAADIDDLRARVLGIVGPLVPEPRVFMLAARPALEGSLMGDDDLRARSGLPDFLGALGRFLVEERGAARIGRALRVASARHSGMVEGLSLRAALLRERREDAAGRRTEKLRQVGQVEEELERLRMEWQQRVEAEVASVREGVLARAAALQQTVSGTPEAAGMELRLHNAFVDLAQRSVTELHAGIGRAARSMQGLLDPDQPGLRWVSDAPAGGAATNLSRLAPAAPEAPLVTPRSAMAAAGMMGAVSLIGLFTPAVVLFAGLLAFLHVRSKEEDEEAPGRARSLVLQERVQEATRRLLEKLVEERESAGRAAWAELAQTVTARQSSARAALAAAEADLAQDERARREAAETLGVFRERLNEAMRALQDDVGAWE